MEAESESTDYSLCDALVNLVDHDTLDMVAAWVASASRSTSDLM